MGRVGDSVTGDVSLYLTAAFEACHELIGEHSKSSSPRSFSILAEQSANLLKLGEIILRVSSPEHAAETIEEAAVVLKRVAFLPESYSIQVDLRKVRGDLARECGHYARAFELYEEAHAISVVDLNQVATPRAIGLRLASLDARLYMTLQREEHNPEQLLAIDQLLYQAHDQLSFFPYAYDTLRLLTLRGRREIWEALHSDGDPFSLVKTRLECLQDEFDALWVYLRFRNDVAESRS